MAIDAGIIGGIRPVRLENPINRMAQVLQVQGLQDQAAVRAMEMDKARRELADTNALNEAYKEAMGADGTPDRNKLFSTLASRGLGAKVPGLQKQFMEVDAKKADIGKTEAETKAKQFEVANKRVDVWGSSMGFVRQNPTAENATAAIQHLVNLGVMPPETAQSSMASIQANPTPQNIAKWAEMGFRAALSAKDQLSQFQTRNTGGSTDTLAIDPVTNQTRVVNSVQNTQSPDNAASVAATIRGQNMTDARAREATAAVVTKPFEVTGEDGKPVLVQQDKQGNIRPVQGYAPKSGGKPMTESQAKANLFGSRMKESDRILSELEGKYSPLAVNAKMGAEKLPGGLGGLAGAAGNAMLSAEGQKAEQAQRDFVNAVLRRESGAVISDQEFANAQKQYFPQANDSPAVLQQKRRNRQMAIQGLEAEVPGGLRMGGSGGSSGGWSIQKVN